MVKKNCNQFRSSENALLKLIKEMGLQSQNNYLICIFFFQFV